MEKEKTRISVKVKVDKEIYEEYKKLALEANVSPRDIMGNMLQNFINGDGAA